MAIENIVFDADGVVQYATKHWQPALQSALSLDDELQARAVLFLDDKRRLAGFGVFVDH